jgi:hypothetical protein
MPDSERRLTATRARELLGHEIVLKANGGQIVTGELIGLIDSPAVIVRTRGLDADRTFVLNAVEDYIVGLPVQRGGL